MKKTLFLSIIISSFLTACVFDFKTTDQKSNENPYGTTPYRAKMIDFFSMETMAYDIFPLDTTLAGKEKSLSELKDRGLYYWNRNLEILKEINELTLSANQKAKTKVLEKYCHMQIKCYELMYKAIDQHTHQYDAEIEKQMSQIQAYKSKHRQDPD